jgi:hypothetical protein
MYTDGANYISTACQTTQVMLQRLCHLQVYFIKYSLQLKIFQTEALHNLSTTLYCMY